MGWRCFFGHKWKEEHRNLVKVYGEARDMPIAHETHFLFKCKNCEEVKTKIVNGFFSIKDDDDDDDKDPPPPPILSPDDFYESLNK